MAVTSEVVVANVVRCTGCVELPEGDVRECPHARHRLIVDALAHEVGIYDVVQRTWRVAVVGTHHIFRLIDTHRRISLRRFVARVFVQRGQTRECVHVDEVIVVLTGQ